MGLIDPSSGRDHSASQQPSMPCKFFTLRTPLWPPEPRSPSPAQASLAHQRARFWKYAQGICSRRAYTHVSSVAMATPADAEAILMARLCYSHRHNVVRTQTSQSICGRAAKPGGGICCIPSDRRRVCITESSHHQVTCAQWI